MYCNIDIDQFVLEKCVPSKLVEPTVEIVFNHIDELQLSTALHAQQTCENLPFPFSRSGLFELPIKQAQTLVAGVQYDGVADEAHLKRVLELTLDTEHMTALDYQPGDTIGILPRNSKTEVQQVLAALQLEQTADLCCGVQFLSTCTKKNAKLPLHIPHITTPRQILQDCLNLRAVLKKQFLRSLAECCSITQHRRFLESLSSKEGSVHYNTLILEKGLTLVNVLDICHSCKPTLALLVEHLPRLLPRPYSIANSPLQQANDLHIIFSILPRNPGVTTNMLNDLATLIKQPKVESENPPKLLAYLRDPNTFRYTNDDVASQQILIAIGTGLAPFLGFLEHKKQLAGTGQTWLFAGATKAESLPHRDRLVQHQKQGVLNRYFESFSRQTDVPYQYVQDQLKANASEFVEFLLQPSTVLYLCADGAQISKSIETAIHDCLMHELNLKQEAEATKMLKDFRISGKFREDLWL